MHLGASEGYHIMVVVLRYSEVIFGALQVGDMVFGHGTEPGSRLPRGLC